MHKIATILIYTLISLNIPFVGLCNDLSIYNDNISEAQKFELLNGKVERYGSTLTLLLENEVKIDFADVYSDGENRRVHRFLGIDEVTKNYVIEISHLEWMTILLIDPANGRLLPIESIPFYSPSKLYFYCFKPSGMDGSLITIYRKNENTFERILYHSPVGWNAEEPKWHDDSTIAYKAFKYITKNNVQTESPRLEARIICNNKTCEVVKPKF